jgi:hypothetical protein
VGGLGGEECGLGVWNGGGRVDEQRSFERASERAVLFSFFVFGGRRGYIERV